MKDERFPSQTSDGMPARKPAMHRWNHSRILLLTLGLSGTLLDQGQAHRELFTPEEKEQLKRAERIHLEALALTDRGAIDPASVAAAASARLKILGYTIVPDPAQPHDVTVKVKCEEHKVWEGTVTSGGDADQLDAASRLWKGPACQITYRVNGHGSDWRHEVRSRSSAPPSANASQPPAPIGPEAIAQLAARLREDLFPLLLAGSWGQSPRLMKVLDDSTASREQTITAITLLGNMFAVEAIPSLNRKLRDKDPAVVRSSAVALGAIGHADCIPLLLNLLTHKNPDTRLAAITGLGRLAPLHPNSNIVPTLLARLPHEPVPIQTAIVRALGKTTDRRILEPLRALNRVAQNKSRSEHSLEWKELIGALSVSLDQFAGSHSDE